MAPEPPSAADLFRRTPREYAVHGERRLLARQALSPGRTESDAPSGGAGSMRAIQPRVVVLAVTALGGGSAWLVTHYGPGHGALLPIGAALVTAADGAGIRAQLLMLAVATVLFAPALAAGEVFGRPVVGAVAPASLSVLVGAFVFAIGMQLGGGCGSGTLYQVGAGRSAPVVTLIFFVVGAVLATFHMPFWAALPSLGEISLGERFGWRAAVAGQLAVCGLLASGTLWLERRCRPQAPPRVSASPGGWRRVAQGPWSLAVGAVLLAALNFLTLLVAGHPWTITWAFALWGAKAVALSGYGVTEVPFWAGPFQQRALAAPVLADVTSVMDIGLVLGAFLGAGPAGRFAPASRVPPSRLAASVIGGVMLGYGARIAFGCNIGALFSGVASTSPHGGLWGAAALAGTPIGVRLPPPRRRRLRWKSAAPGICNPPSGVDGHARGPAVQPPYRAESPVSTIALKIGSSSRPMAWTSGWA